MCFNKNCLSYVVINNFLVFSKLKFTGNRKYLPVIDSNSSDISVILVLIDSRVLYFLLSTEYLN